MEKFIEAFDVSEWEIDTPHGWNSISKVFKTIPYQIYQIKTNDNLSLKCADEHILIRDDNSEVLVKDLKVHDKILSRHRVSIITEIEILNEFENMYDLEIDNDEHLYYSNDIVSHNTTTAAAFLLYQVIFNEDYACAVIANKAAMANEILDKTKQMFEGLPWYLKPGTVEWNKGSIKLSNGSKILAAATSSSSIRGRAMNCVTGNTKVKILDTLTNEEKYVTIDELKLLLETETNYE